MLEADGETIEQVDVPVDRLPTDDRHEWAVFEVTIADGDLSDAVYLPDETSERRMTTQERLDNLSTRLGNQN